MKHKLNIKIKPFLTYDKMFVILPTGVVSWGHNSVDMGIVWLCFVVVISIDKRK